MGAKTDGTDAVIPSRQVLLSTLAGKLTVDGAMHGRQYARLSTRS